MREFKIAVASSRKAGKWTNTTMTWLDLCARIRKTFYTAETSAEYWGMTKDERDAAKDRGGFVGGYLKNGRRKITDVECRSLITHDVDDPDPGFFDRFTQGFKYAAVLYSTHSHMSDRPRYRVVIPLWYRLFWESHQRMASKLRSVMFPNVRPAMKLFFTN